MAAEDTTWSALSQFSSEDFKNTHYLACRPNQYGKNYWIMYAEGKVPQGVHAIPVPAVAIAQLSDWSYEPFLYDNGVYVPANVISGTNHYRIEEMPKPQHDIGDGNDWYTWSEVMLEYNQLVDDEDPNP